MLNKAHATGTADQIESMRCLLDLVYKQIDSHDTDESPLPEVQSHFENLQRRLNDDSTFQLREDLKVAYHRFMAKDPAWFSVSPRYQIKFEFNPNRFAEFLEELLEDGAPARRAALVSDAWTVGFSPDGLSADEITQRTDEMLMADSWD